MYWFLCIDILQSVSNHPVHLYDEGGKLSPSAFIPFCDFGGRMSVLGESMEPYDLPVCKSFQAKIWKDQLCYEVHLDKYKNKDNIDKDLELGLVFLLDYNEDRQVKLEEHNENKENPGLFVTKVDKSKDNDNAFIYLNTIGMIYDIKYDIWSSLKQNQLLPQIP